jgi:hypothetical protein
MKPNDSLTRAGLAAINAALGEPRKALEAINSAQASGYSKDWQLPYLAAVTHARLGMQREALGDIEVVLERGFPRVLLRMDPALRDVVERLDRENSR